MGFCDFMEKHETRVRIPPSRQYAQGFAAIHLAAKPFCFVGPACPRHAFGVGYSVPLELLKNELLAHESISFEDVFHRKAFKYVRY